MSAFDQAFKWMLPHEGGYSNDPDDKGGATKFGIASRYHPDVDVANLTEDAAAAIYRREYWDPINGDGIAAIDPKLAMKVFDSSVNIGTIRAAKMLQSAIADLGLVVSVDGRVGQMTLDALGHADPAAVKDRFITRLSNYYQSLNNPKFERGWLKRARDWPA